MTLALHGKSRRRKSWLLFAALIAIVFGVSGSLMLNRDETKADSTTVIEMGNLDGSPAANAWLYYNDLTDTANNAPGALGSFVAGPGTPPAGAGSAGVIDLGGTATKTLLGTYQFRSTKLQDITKLEYSAYNVDASYPAFLNLNVSFDGTDNWQNRLVYVPSTVNAGQWETYDAYQGGAAMWTWSKNAANWPGTAIPSSTPRSWSALVTQYSANLKVRDTDSLFGIRVGHGVAGEPAGNVYIDKFVIEISGDEKTFDFEPTVQCTTDCYVDATLGNDLFGGSPASPYKTIAAAYTAVSAGGTVHVAAGTYPVSSLITVNKQVSFVGTGMPVIQVSGTGERFLFLAPGSTLQGFKVEKTDKVGVQNIIQIQANNTTITGNEFTGQYVLGDGDVSRALVTTSGLTGVTITNNTFHHLRQPAYLNGYTTGTIANNYTYATKGWVLEHGEMTFTNNTWGTGSLQNVVDIAILSMVPGTYYTDVPGMSAANNDAYIEDQRTLPPTMSIVYVAPWGNNANLGTAADPKKTVQAGIDRVVIGGTVHVLPGTYNEDVNINKAGVKVFGAGIDSAIISGPIGGPVSTVQVAAANVLLDGFTITRAGNNVSDWNNPGINSAGVAVQSQGNTVELRNSKLVGNRTGVDINNSNGNNIHNNIINNNRTGLILRNQTDNTVVKNNFIANNWTVGIVFLDASVGTNSPVQQALNSQFIENDLSGNWYGAVDDRQTGGSLPADGSNPKNFENNWWGTTTPTVDTASSNEPGYSGQIPLAYGGSAVPPAGPINSIYGPAEQNIDYQPFLCQGTDSSPVVGFQPVFGCGDIEIVAPATADVGDTGITVTVVANNAVNLYGVQTKITYGAGLQLTNVTLGPGLSPDFVSTNTTSPGVVSFSYTQQSPTSPKSGSGLVLATLTFTAVGAGTPGIQAVPANTLFSNNLGFPIGPNAYVNDSIVISATGFSITGNILLQGRTDFTGAMAEIDPPAFPGIGSPNALSNNVGAFAINTGPSGGTHTIRGRMLGYLLAVKTMNLIPGANNAGTVTLVGGDADMSGTINVLDLSLIAGYFGQTGPGFTPAPAANTTPDINGDAIVNILDLSLTAANYGQVGPTTWP